MTDLTQMIRWNANFVRGLAESVLNRAKVIRSSLTPETGKSVAPRKRATAKKTAGKPVVKRATKSGRRHRRDDA